MNISYNWLLKYIDTKLTPAEVAEKLTSVGLEVESVEAFNTLPDGLDSLTIGEVLDVWQHPNADRLRLTKVNVGNGEPLQIVCGAPNVAKGQKVIVATDGVTIHPTGGEPFKIKNSKIRGELSQGMICAEDEIGLGTDHDGIKVLPSDAPIGQPVSEYLKAYKDTTIEIGLTPNRVDAASHIGIARDLAAALGLKVNYPEIDAKSSSGDKLVDIQIDSPDDCPRYSGLVVRNVEVKDSPEWLKNYLLAAGLSPINNIVDVTNFVMYEMGQPIHAFDLSHVKGNKIIIKKAAAGSKFMTLDKQERTLDGSELMICNAEEPMAIAGVFGGLKSGIKTDTKDIFIESAYFNPSTVRQSSRRHGLFTDASFRYERGADPSITVKAAFRVAELIKEVAGGDIQPFIYDAYPKKIESVNVNFSLSYLNKLAGMEYDPKDVKSILQDLELKILEEKGDELLLEIPLFKVDVTRPADVAEEVMRIYSFDKIPITKQVKAVLQTFPYNDREKLRERISAFLVDKGLYETYMLSFSREEDNAVYPEAPVVKLLNPLSAEMAEMRNNMLVGGLRAVMYNLNRQQDSVKFFKWGSVYSAQGDNIIEKFRLGIWLTGPSNNPNWHDKGHDTDFYDLKGIAEKVLHLAGVKADAFSDVKDKRFDYAAEYYIGKRSAVKLGKVRKKLLKQVDIEREVYYAEFDAELLLEKTPEPQYTPISRFPKMERDLALLVPEHIAYADIKTLIEQTGGKLLKEVSIFDVYQGKQVQEGMKSYAIHLEFEDPNQTLEDKQVDSAIGKIVKRLEQNLEIKIRQ